MDPAVRRLFEALVGLSPSEQQKVLDERQVAPELRAEVESLLSFDAQPDHRVTAAVASAATDLLDSREPATAADWGPFRRLRLLGTGGMSSVYLAERSDGEIQQVVAVKVLHAGAGRPSWMDRFLQERQVLANMNHPGIARLIDAGRTPDGQPYLAMEFVDGAAIDTYAASLSVRDRLALFLRVCDAVAYAHRHLVIHRDIKPSNILVDSSGQPKLLDFGIAKWLGAPGDRTHTIDRMLTPNYASPEQVRGEADTTATDVYSLGAVLHKMLTGRSPREAGDEAGAQLPPRARAAPQWIATTPDTPADAAYILRKALRADPGERYLSVEALANDVRALLEWRPVQARSGDLWYRTRRFLRRYRAAAAAALLIVLTLSLGLYFVNRERAIAERRFQQVRQLANKVLNLDRVMRDLPGSTKVRQGIVQISQEYLEGLVSEAGSDADLGLELGNAYVLLARAQGVPTQPNLGMHDQAKESLSKAETLLQNVIRTAPENRTALMALADISHDLMILADTGRRDDEALAHARDATARLQTVFDQKKPTPAEVSSVATIFMNVALLYKNLHRYDECVRQARRVLDILPPQAPGDYFGNALSLIADARRFSGDLSGALQAITEARQRVDMAMSTKGAVEIINRYNILSRQGVILGGDGQVSLDRTDEAVESLQEAFDILEGIARADPDDALGRLRFATAGRELGGILRHRDPEHALKVFDHALVRLREVKNNTRARRGEAQIMAASSYVLRRLNRADEARRRVDGALQLLRDTKHYPADRIAFGDEAESVLRAWGDHLGDTGEPGRAAQVYEDLIGKVMASRPDPTNDLPHATSLSRLYERLGDLHRRNAHPELAQALAAKRREIWDAWARRLPQNPYIQKQLAAALLQ
jgi:tetratricopeptide (TPR) repeat protein